MTTWYQKAPPDVKPKNDVETTLADIVINKAY